MNRRKDCDHENNNEKTDETKRRDARADAARQLAENRRAQMKNIYDIENAERLEAMARIGELAIAAQKSTDCYCNESTIGPSEADWSADGTEEHKLWTRMESDIAALRAAIDAHFSSPNT